MTDHYVIVHPGCLYECTTDVNGFGVEQTVYCVGAAPDPERSLVEGHHLMDIFSGKVHHRDVFQKLRPIYGSEIMW